MDKEEQDLGCKISILEVEKGNEIKSDSRMQSPRCDLRGNGWECFGEFLEVFICEIKISGGCCCRSGYSEVYDWEW